MRSLFSRFCPEFLETNGEFVDYRAQMRGKLRGKQRRLTLEIG